jgi:hypothetical protein
MLRNGERDKRQGVSFREQPVQGGTAMKWETPSFAEVKMDAEINSYQDDFRETPDVRVQPSQAAVGTASQAPAESIK